MKKLFTLLLLSLSLIGIGQVTDQADYSSLVPISNRSGSYGNDAYYQTSTWPSDMASAYLAINDHYSESFANSTREFIEDLFTTESYYETTFGDSTTAGWFFVIHPERQDVILLIDVTKTGETLRWEVDDSIYNVDDMPQHNYVDSTWIICSSKDGFNNMTRFYYQNQAYTIGQMPNIQSTSLQRLYILNNSFSGTFPTFNLPGLYFNRFNDNDMDSITTIEGLLNPNLGWLYLHDNLFRRADIDLVLSEMSDYYRENLPTKDFDLKLEGNSAPTGDSCNSDLIMLDSLWNSEGFTLTYTIETDDSIPELNQIPYLTLPDTIYQLVGTQDTIFDCNVASMAIDENALNLNYVCDIGSQTWYGYIFDEVVGDVGFHDLTIYARAGCDTIDTVSTVIRLLEPLVSATEKSVLIVGNSLTARKPWVDSIRTTVTGADVRLTGSQGTSPNYSEGRTGYTLEDYVTDWRIVRGLTNPFWDGTKFNFTAYREDTISEASPIDFLYIQIGINDIKWDYIDTAWIEDTWLGYMKMFVDSALYDGTGHIILCMEPKITMRENLYDAVKYDNQDSLIAKVQYTWLRLNQIYSGKRYSNKVWVSHQGLFIDAYNDYYDNFHPNIVEYYKIAQPARAIMEGILKEESE